MMQNEHKDCSAGYHKEVSLDGYVEILNHTTVNLLLRHTENMHARNLVIRIIVMKTSN